MGLHKLRSQIFHLLSLAFEEGTQCHEPEHIPHFKRWLKDKAQREGQEPEFCIQRLIFTRKTYDAYREIGDRFAGFLWTTFQCDDVWNVTPAMIYAYLTQDLNWSKSYAKQIGSAITKIGARVGRYHEFRRACKKAMKREFPKPPPPRVLDPDQQLLVIELLRQKGEPEGRILACRIVRETGLRRLEVTTRWRWRHPKLGPVIQDHKLVVFLGKGGKPRELPLSPELEHDLLAFQAKYGDTKLDSYQGHYRAWRAACKELGFPWNTHARRHGSAQGTYCDLRASGMSPERAAEIVRERLGHGKQRQDVTDLYLGKRGGSMTLGGILRHLDQMEYKLRMIEGRDR